MNDLVLRMLKGNKRTRSEHEGLVYNKSMELVADYDIVFDPKTPIPLDVSMADRVFSAAVDLLADVGIYCADTNRVLEFSRSEIRKCIRNSRTSFNAGSGAESTRVSFRKVLDENVPFIIGGPDAVPVSDDMYLPIHRSYAKINLVDSIAPASLHNPNILDHKFNFKGSPLTLSDAHRGVSLIKEACKLEGRPDICCVSPPYIDDIKAAISIANGKTMGSGDLQELYPRPDLEANFDEISRITHYRFIGSYYIASSMLIMGGVTSAIPEQFAIEMTAELLKSSILYRCQLGYIYPSHLQGVASRSLDVLWASFVTSMAITRNTRILHGVVVNNASGPCTESMMYETAVQTIGSTVCGVDSISGPVSSGGNELNHCAGMDALFMAKTAELATSLSLADANYLCLALFEEYRNKKPEFGKKFKECYDLHTVEPTTEYLILYEKAMETVYDMISERF